jgi:hypothetical protein
MRRITLNIISLLIFIGVIVGGDLALRSLGVDHTDAWLLGMVAGVIAMACMQISGVYSRSWREGSPPQAQR